MPNSIYDQDTNSATSVMDAMGRARNVGAVGPGGVDVRSYSGSIYNGGAQPIPGYQRQETSSQAADRILRGRFGAPPNERGQVDIATAMGVRSQNAPAGAPAPAAAMGYSAPNGAAAGTMPSPAAARMAMTGGASRTFNALPFNSRSAILQTTYGLKKNAAIAMTNNFSIHPEQADAMLGGTHLDPAYRAAQVMDLGLQIDDRRALATERQTQTQLRIDAAAEKTRGLTSKAAQEAANKAALFRAMQPIAVPGATRPRSAAEGAYIMRDPTISTPASSREPTVAEAMRSYMSSGGAPSPTVDNIVKAMGAAQPFQAHEETLPSGAKVIYNTPKSAIPNPQQPRPKAPGAATGIEQVTIGGKPYEFHAKTNRYFNPNGTEAFTKGGAEPKAPDPLVKEADPELYQAQRETYLAWHKAKAGKGEVAAPGAASTAAAPGATAAAPNAAPAAPAFKSADEVQAAYKAGTLKKEDALKLLREKFGHK